MLAVQADGVECRDHRRADGAQRHRRSAAGVRRPQRAAMRILHARHAGDRGRIAGARQADPGGDPRGSVRQLLPLHWLSGDRRCDRSRCGTPSGCASHDRQPAVGSGAACRAARPSGFAEGRGRYTDDLDVANVGHIAFLRSPHPHARIRRIDGAAAGQSPGVIAVVTGDDLAAICKPWQTQLALLPGHSSPPQYPLARGEACWQGEAVVAVVAVTRAQAEDAVELIEIDWEELPAVPNCRDRRGGRRAGVPQRQGEQSWSRSHRSRPAIPIRRLRDAAVVVEHDFVFERQTGVTLEPRVIVADFDPRLRQLTVHHSHQVPHQMRDIFAAQLGLAAFARPRRRAGCRRRVRHEAVRLSRRDGGGCDRGAARPAGQVQRRSSGIVRQRHPRARSQGPRPARGRCRRPPHGDGGVGGFRLRRLRQLSARQRRRRLADRPHVGRGLPAAEFSRPGARLFPEQAAERRAARCRPADRNHRHGTAFGFGRAQAGHRSGGAAPAQLRGGGQAGRNVGRRHRARQAVARSLPRPAADADGLRWAPPAAGRASQARRLPRHRARGVHRADRGRSFALRLDAGSRFRERGLPAHAGARTAASAARPASPIRARARARR